MQTNVHSIMLFNTVLLNVAQHVSSLQLIYSESSMTGTDTNNQIHLTAF
jgi:hypothetical protein